MVDPHELAKDWAKVGLCNPTFTAKLRTARDELAVAMLSPSGMDSITSATKNAISVAKTQGATIPETLAAMNKALDWIALGYIPTTSRSFGRF
jgi:hypothetical protein